MRHIPSAQSAVSGSFAISSEAVIKVEIFAAPHYFIKGCAVPDSNKAISGESFKIPSSPYMSGMRHIPSAQSAVSGSSAMVSEEVVKVDIFAAPALFYKRLCCPGFEQSHFG